MPTPLPSSIPTPLPSLATDAEDDGEDEDDGSLAAAEEMWRGEEKSCFFAPDAGAAACSRLLRWLRRLLSSVVATWRLLLAPALSAAEVAADGEGPARTFPPEALADDPFAGGVADEDFSGDLGGDLGVSGEIESLTSP